VVLAGVVIAGLAAWAAAAPNGRTSRHSCGLDVNFARPEAAEAHRERCRVEEAARDQRRRVAAIAGTVVVVGIFAATTIPSRRLTGDALDLPLR
jgi:hypothetical protein